VKPITVADGFDSHFGDLAGDLRASEVPEFSVLVAPADVPTKKRWLVRKITWH